MSDLALAERTCAAILDHAHAQMPRESCGVIINARGHERYVPCRNLAERPEQHFVIDPLDYIDAEDRADVIAVVHSHPYAPAQPTQPDLVACERSGVPWIIVSVPNDVFHSFKPSGYRADYVGRQFCYGVLDCFELVRDWYRGELGIEIPERPEAASSPSWWKGREARELYIEGYAASGFVAVEEPEPGDMLLFQVGADVANHAAIYIGQQVILHHVWSRLSCREIYGGYWVKNMRVCIRHKTRL